ncbi:MAG: hypothetical protein U0872_09340 [Planctomycetaceae bacterium]
MTFSRKLPRNSSRLKFLPTCSLALAICAAGCNQNHRPKVYPVKGILLVGGKPAGGAHLAFHAVDQPFVFRPVAITKPDGTFQLMTHATGDGAPAGNYVVTIFWHDVSHPADDCEHHDLIQHDRFHGFYADSTSSPLRANVRRGANELLIQATDPRELSASHSLKNGG